jgi:NADH-quinone oxidoreductase subunit A
MAAYLPIVILFVLAFVFVFGSIVASTVLGPRRRETAAKIGPYECGIVPDKEPAERFPVRFYLVAMIFIIFDIEIIFLYPWAVRFGALGVFGLVEMIVFSVAVIVAFTYLISNGALDWAPINRLRRLEVTASRALDARADRTTASTIRKVSRPAPVADETAA